VGAGTPNLRVVLWEPQDLLNIGAVVRVCRNCAITDLRLVRPAEWDLHRVTITAPHSADWVAHHVRLCDDWDDAMDGVITAYALTARAREERTARLRLHEAAERILGTTEQSAFVFGREDHGLPNAIIEKCHAYVTLETSADYPSINLAQAVLLVAHHVFVRSGAAVPMPPPAKEFPRADVTAIDRMLGDMANALDGIGFFKGDQRDAVMGTLRRSLLRAELDQRELATWWAVAREVERAGGAR
jgi:TrmH family RNA methyltransferase